jgi:4-hydroxybenzoate polyprenyltransferase
MRHKLADIQGIQSIFLTVYVLELAGATAITSLGWAACRILQIDSLPSAPLWFAGYLLVYNLDRLYPDPADLVNISVRVSKAQKVRAARIGLAFLSVAVLLVWTLLTGRWWLVLALALAAIILQFYSRPVPGAGFRLKDLFYVKSFLLPGLIAGILVGWPCIENGRSFRLKEYLVFLWCILLLTINSLVFDYRDIEGDSFVGTLTIPVRLGRRNTIYLLIGLTVALAGVSAWLSTMGFLNPLMPAALAGASTGLLLALGRRPCPITISVLADLLLVIPAAVEIFV